MLSRFRSVLFSQFSLGAEVYNTSPRSSKRLRLLKTSVPRWSLFIYLNSKLIRHEQSPTLEELCLLIIGFNLRKQHSPAEEPEMAAYARTAIERLTETVQSSGDVDRRSILACVYEWLVSAPQDELHWDIGRQGTHRLWFITRWAKSHASMDMYPEIEKRLQPFLAIEGKRLGIGVSPATWASSCLLSLPCIELR